MSPAGQDDADLVVEEIDIHRAVGRNDEELINKFVLGGGNLEARDKDWLTPLHVAAAGGLLAAVEFFMKHKGRAKLVDSKSKIGHTPLHLACRFGHLPVVLLLLAEDADINAKDNDDNTPLHKAASNGKAQLCRELVKRGADVDARNSTEYTPLHWACLKGHKGAVEQLLKCGANINATSSRRATGLFLSSYYGYADVTFLLIAWGADTAITNEDDLKPGDAFLPEVSLAQRKQTRVLLAEKLALLMKGYEATRRNMALMYMRSERSELNLRMTQGEVETLWTQLGKREKELNRSKIGARDLSHAVKSMKAALETTREESKAAWDTVEALQVELKSAQLEAQEQSERALRAERSLAELRRRTGDTPSSGEEAEGRNASDERSAVPPDSSSTETPTAAAAAAVSTATESELQKRRIRETAEESALRRYSLASFEGRSFESSNNTSVCSSSAPSPETSASLPPSQQLSLSLPAGRIAELASAINSRVARLGHGAVEPLPPPPPPPPLTSTNNKADRFRRCSASAAVGGGGSPASLPPLRGRGGSRYGGAKRRASGAGGVGDRATPTSTTTTVASSSYCRCFSSAPSLSLSSACCSSSSSSCSCVPNVSRWRSAAASSTGPSDSVAVPAIDSSAHAAATAGDATRTPAVDKNSSTSSSAGAASDWTSALSAGFPCMRAGDCSPSPEVAEARRRTASRAATVARLIGIATEKEERQGGGPLSVAVQKHGDDEGDRQWHKSNHSDETLPASPETASARRSSAHADAGEEVAATGRRDASCSSDSPRAVAEVASAEPSAAERTLGTEGVSVEGGGEGEGEEDAKFSSKRTQ